MNEDSDAGQGRSPTTNPLDDITIQAPGRLLTVEILLALLAGHHPRKDDIFSEARNILTRIEQQMQSELDGRPAGEKLGNMFIVSRSWLAKLEDEATK